ncbi:hypothetical protein HYS97_00410 [Candidatus Daviesbacteria bacterium]|nr:hypothetical protein [Candidatus Daviesbacteria bacterium]
MERTIEQKGIPMLAKLTRGFVGVIRGLPEVVAIAAMAFTNRHLFFGRMTGEELDRWMGKQRERTRVHDKPIQQIELPQTEQKPVGLSYQEVIEDAARVVRGSFY